MRRKLFHSSNHKPLLFARSQILILTHVCERSLRSQVTQNVFPTDIFLSHQQHLKNDFWDKICFGLGVVCAVFTIFEHKVFSSLPFVRQDLQKVFNISLRKIISYPPSFIHCSYNYRCQDPFLTKRATTRRLPKCMMLDVQNFSSKFSLMPMNSQDSILNCPICKKGRFINLQNSEYMGLGQIQ